MVVLVHILGTVLLQAATPQVTPDVRPDWSSAASAREVQLETTDGHTTHLVTLWCVVVDGRLYLATDDSRERKRWVRELRSHPDASLTVAGKTYPVRATPVHAQAIWKVVMDAYGEKYRDEIGNYDFPKADDLSSGAIFELEARARPRS